MANAAEASSVVGPELLAKSPIETLAQRARRERILGLEPSRAEPSATKFQGTLVDFWAASKPRAAPYFNKLNASSSTAASFGRRFQLS